jgi:hypothetical protein
VADLGLLRRSISTREVHRGRVVTGEQEGGQRERVSGRESRAGSLALGVLGRESRTIGLSVTIDGCL